MNPEQWTTVDRYINDLFVPSDPALDTALRANAAAGLPPHDVAPNQGKLLMLLAQLWQTQAILEIGTLGAYSTIWLAKGLAPNGRLVTLEANSQFAQLARENLARASFRASSTFGSGRRLIPWRRCMPSMPVHSI